MCLIGVLYLMFLNACPVLWLRWAGCLLYPLTVLLDGPPLHLVRAIAEDTLQSLYERLTILEVLAILRLLDSGVNDAGHLPSATQREECCPRA